MADISELSVQYRIVGTACRKKLLELEQSLREEDFCDNAFELKRRITMLTAMSRDCITTANYLQAYSERRQRLEWVRRQET